MFPHDILSRVPRKQEKENLQMPTMSNSLHEQPEDLFDLRRRDAVSPRQAAEWIPDLFDSQSLAGVSAASFPPQPSRNAGGGDRQELSGAGEGIFHQNKVIIEKSISLAAHDSRGERKGTLRPNHPPLLFLTGSVTSAKTNRMIVRTEAYSEKSRNDHPARKPLHSRIGFHHQLIDITHNRRCSRCP